MKDNGVQRLCVEVAAVNLDEYILSYDIGSVLLHHTIREFDIIHKQVEHGVVIEFPKYESF